LQTSNSITPVLIIIGGCNGSGKSTYAPTLISNNHYPKEVFHFDGDKVFKEEYEKLDDSEYRELYAKKYTEDKFAALKEECIKSKTSFAYETNFNNNPHEIINEFKASGFRIHLHYFCLENILLAEERVAIRHSKGGHFVRKEEIKYRFEEGYKNLDSLFQDPHKLFIYDNSTDSLGLREVLRMEQGNVLIYESDNNIIHNLPLLESLQLKIKTDLQRLKNNGMNK
jgi:predicted ABC-type ATPase